MLVLLVFALNLLQHALTTPLPLHTLTLQVRAHVEQQIALIAEGKAQKDAVVRHTLEQFRQK